MFIKITKSRDHQYVQLVRSYRENGVVKHKVLLNLGRLDEIENNPSFQRLEQRCGKGKERHGEGRGVGLLPRCSAILR